MDKFRFIADTNVLISNLLFYQSVPARALRLALDFGILLTSQAALDELATVLSRPKFDAYVSSAVREEFIRKILRISVRVEIIQRVEVCRDPKDDKFLEIAVNGDADWLLTGDSDLLVLHPFQDTAIVTPGDFIARIESRNASL
jgi:uncharacterized protein